MTATADIVTTARNNVLLVPNAALRFKPTTATPGAAPSGGIAGALVPTRPRRGGGGRGDVSVVRGGSQTVYVKDANGQPKPVSITTGVTNGTMTEVIGGDLQPGMQVITGQLSGTSTKRRRPAGAGGPGGGGQQSGQ